MWIKSQILGITQCLSGKRQRRKFFIENEDVHPGYQDEAGVLPVIYKAYRRSFSQFLPDFISYVTASLLCFWSVTHFNRMKYADSHDFSEQHQFGNRLAAHCI